MCRGLYDLLLLGMLDEPCHFGWRPLGNCCHAAAQRHRLIHVLTASAAQEPCWNQKWATTGYHGPSSCTSTCFSNTGWIWLDHANPLPENTLEAIHYIRSLAISKIHSHSKSNRFPSQSGPPALLWAFLCPATGLHRDSQAVLEVGFLDNICAANFESSTTAPAMRLVLPQSIQFGSCPCLP